MVAATRETRVWADQGLALLNQRQTLLAALVSESKIKVAPGALTANSPTLKQAIRRLADAEAAALQQVLVETTQFIVQEGSRRIVDAEAAKRRQEYDAMIAKRDQEIADLKAEMERQATLHAASNRVAEAEADTAVARRMDEATRLKLLRKSEDPAILAKLKPFTTPGYWQPRGKAFERQPRSYSQLQSVGALNKDGRSLQRLVDVMFTRDDDERPRVRIGGTARSWNDTSAGIDRITEIQNLIIELGPTLVEQGKLAK